MYIENIYYIGFLCLDFGKLYKIFSSVNNFRLLLVGKAQQHGE